ncbi:MAG: Caulobacter phage Seuss, partial [Pseudomonadota bacterium]
ANCAASATGTQLVELTNATSNWRNAPSSGTSTLAGSFTGTVAADGTAGYYRVWDSGASTCHEQGSVTRAFSKSTSASTSAGSNILTFADTTGISVGMSVTATGVPSGAVVAGTTSTTVSLSAATTGSGVGSGASVYFGDTAGDLFLNATALTTGQTLTISLWDRTAPGA